MVKLQLCVRVCSLSGKVGIKAMCLVMLCPCTVKLHPTQSGETVGSNGPSFFELTQYLVLVSVTLMH